MEVSGEVADLMVKEGLQASETAVKLAGSGLKNLAALLFALAKANYKTVGSTSINRLMREQSPAMVAPLKTEDLQKFRELAKKYGVLYSAVEPKNCTSGIVDIISTQNCAAQLNAVFEALGYPIPQKEEPTLKKAQARTPQEKSLSERGNGLTNTQTLEKPSVREKLETLKAASEQQKKSPVKVKDKVR